MRRLFFSIYLALGIAATAVNAIGSASAAVAEKRVALVIGNSAYVTAPRLDNPTTDAKAIAASLKRLGFTVVEGYDLNINEMRAKVREYSDNLADAKSAVLYYAGHGVSMDEDNYLLPTEIVLKTPADLDLNALNLTTVLRQMQREERVNVVILDACRDNPFAKELSRTAKRAAIADRGLSSIDAQLAKGTLIAFATDPKSTALDGKPGGNSPFTTALLKHIETPAISVGTMMDRVRAEVYESTNKKQTPWVNTSIIGEYSMNPAEAAAPETATMAAFTPQTAASTPGQDRAGMEARFWESAERGNQVDDYQAYLDSYPSGIYSQMAKNRIARLRGGGNATFTPTPAPTVVASREPTIAPTVDPAKLKADVGTLISEKGLGLDTRTITELQRRLDLLGFKPGQINGKISDKTRSAIGDWQKSHDIAQTTFLGAVQYAALVEESETFYQRYLNAQPMVTDRSLRPSGAPAPRVAPTVKKAQQARRAAPARAASGGGGNGGGGGSNNAGVGAFFGGVVGGIAGAVIRH